MSHSRDPLGGGLPSRSADAGRGRSTARPRAVRGTEPAQSCQSRVLEEWQRAATPLDVFLRNGTKLRGVVSGYDDYMIALDAQGQMQVVYKQAIMNIIPVGPQSADRPPSKRPVIVVKRRSPGHL